MADVKPFPLVRRSGFARRHAELMLGMREYKAEEHLRRQLDVQRQTMARRGIRTELIEPQLAAFAAQVRAEINRAWMRTGGVA